MGCRLFEGAGGRVLGSYGVCGGAEFWVTDRTAVLIYDKSKIGVIGFTYVAVYNRHSG